VRRTFRRPILLLVLVGCGGLGASSAIKDSEKRRKVSFYPAKLPQCCSIIPTIFGSVEHWRVVARAEGRGNMKSRPRRYADRRRRKRVNSSTRAPARPRSRTEDRQGRPVTRADVARAPLNGSVMVVLDLRFSGKSGRSPAPVKWQSLTQCGTHTPIQGHTKADTRPVGRRHFLRHQVTWLSRCGRPG
jgi:hypothetical protein